MIYTVTLNPSMDYLMELDHIEIGEINRSKSEYIKAGGKGINVSYILNKLGRKSVACGFIAGCVGEMIKSELDNENIENIFTNVKGNSRINVKLVCENETAINGTGCIADISYIDILCNSIETNEDDYIVLSGSVCKGLDNNTYRYIMKKLKGRFIVDACGDLLKNSLEEHPFLIKPNNIELGEIFGCNINTFEDAFIYGEKMCNMGAENVIVSMGEKGAVFINKKEKFSINANKICVKNTVGAGDSMTAGFLHSYINSWDYANSLAFGVKIAENKLLNII